MNPANLLSAAKSGTTTSILEFIRKPVIILRLASILVSVIAFGCITSGCHTHNGICIFGATSSACNFPVAIGVFAFLGGILFLVSDFMFNSISNLKRRRHIIIGDLAFSGLWTFLWFVSFCLLANKWTNTSDEWLGQHKVEGWQESNARSAIVFSFLSIAIWSGITFFALQRFRLGQAGLNADEGLGEPGSTMDPNISAPGQSYPGMMSDPMSQQQQQQQLYSGNIQQPPVGGGGQYYGPTY
ncbi:Synaptogyrin-2 [Schistosoma japonicum]|nr:Synaptogyrin-2 [Schistosoma japonicum]KAH8873657.1 Synaptogyrin-2 [Schistosoma japonicum]